MKAERYFERTGSVNALPPRAYFVPSGNEHDAFDGRSGDRFTSLNGTWKIEKYESILDVPDNFCELKPSGEIPVPSCVQLHGMDKNQYVNVWYPIPYDPPFVPNENPTYHYQKTFKLGKNRERTYIVFEGVDSCFYLYINGKFVGFSQISHRISEFDITDFTAPGENKIDMLVLKWGYGTYFEDQDKLRFTGIIRDVYLLNRPEEHIENYAIETSMDGTVKFRHLGGAKAEVTFLKQTKEVSEGEEITFKVEEPRLWSAEDPYLYNLVIKCNGEYIGEKVGIRTSEVKGGVYYLNGKPIKLMGVNRHDFNPHTGAAVTLNDILTDLRLMKELNVNAIRTSHYPSCPEFYKLCDRYGFYVISESDLECHGVTTRDPYIDYFKGFDHMADDERYEAEIVERQKHNVIVNRNRPCVIIWSLGNESGYGKCIEAAAEYVKSEDKTRPVHYEGASHIDKAENEEKYYSTPLDFRSFMYPGYEEFAALKDDKKEKLPVILCEYCHAMGNGPGDFKEYWDTINASDRYAGAFVWEWCDHSLIIDGKHYYGGDFGENLHDGNFCVDGIMSSEREITPKAFEMKKAYEPVFMTFDGNVLKIRSRQYFQPINALLTVIYKNDGKEFGRKQQPVSLAPNEEIEVGLVGSHVKIASLTLTEDKGLLTDGHEIARSGHTDDGCFKKGEVAVCEVVFADNGRFIEATAEDTKFTIDKTSGEICSIVGKCGEILSSPLSFNVWRAPIDNDRNTTSWKAERLRYLRSEAREIEITDSAVKVKGILCCAPFAPAVGYEAEYSFKVDRVDIKVDYKAAEYVKDLPSIGFITSLDKSFNDVKYYGFGPNESYIDRRLSSIKDVYETTVDKMEVNYVKPQENGSRYGTEFMEITDGKTAITVEGNFSFSALPHSVFDYTDNMHDHELPERTATHLRIDFYMSGVGSHSCGPELKKCYAVPLSGRGEISVAVSEKNK